METLALDDSYARAVPEMSIRWDAAPVPDPRLVVLNASLAADLGMDSRTDVGTIRGPDDPTSSADIGLFVGRVPAGVRPTAQAYAGHQFGMYSPVLGDGRALLLGEVLDAAGRRRDLHLKGSGRTPFARGGDGKAVLGPMLREYLLGEAMHALGVPTTRALAVVTTGESVWRDRPQPGAICARVASSHLRVGTVQYAAAHAMGSGDDRVLRAVVEYAIDRHHPQAREAPRPALAFFEAVVAAQAELVAAWMLVGFVHGVMNTDNMTLSGETIDYGPCAFVDVPRPDTVFSSIDHAGRYAYGNQPAIAQWNLARLAEALLPVTGPDGIAPDAVEEATEMLAGFADRYAVAYERGMRRKLGLDVEGTASSLSTADAADIAMQVPDLLAGHGVDHTSFFRALADGRAAPLFAASDESAAGFAAWHARWEAALPSGSARADASARMKRVNPVYIPRNHRVEEALVAATAGDLGPFERLLAAVSRPFEERPDLADLAGPAPAGSPAYVTYCGT